MMLGTYVKKNDIHIYTFKYGDNKIKKKNKSKNRKNLNINDKSK